MTASENEASVWWSSCVQSSVPTLPFSLCQPVTTVRLQQDQGSEPLADNKH